MRLSDVRAFVRRDRSFNGGRVCIERLMDVAWVARSIGSTWKRGRFDLFQQILHDAIVADTAVGQHCRLDPTVVGIGTYMQLAPIAVPGTAVFPNVSCPFIVDLRPVPSTRGGFPSVLAGNRPWNIGPRLAGLNDRTLTELCSASQTAAGLMKGCRDRQDDLSIPVHCTQARCHVASYPGTDGRLSRAPTRAAEDRLV